MDKFSKEQFINSDKFSEHRVVLKALLSDDKKYTIKDVEKILNDFYKKEVK